jgi:hypothetical protein
LGDYSQAIESRAFASECAMNDFLLRVRTYYAFYGSYFSHKWNHMSPMGYGMLLIAVAAFGWLLMKAGNKRS